MTIIATATNESTQSYGSRLLTTVLAVIFMGAIYIFVSYITARAYLRTGVFSFLLLGSSLVIAGCSAVLTFSVSSSSNYMVTEFDLGFLIAAALGFASAVSLYLGTKSTTNVRKWIGTPILTYANFAGVSVAIAELALHNLTPAFFVQGIGRTAIRQEVVLASIVLFGISSLVFLRMYAESHSEILFWYSGGLAMLAVGLFSVFFVTVIGGELSWIGRFAQYLSGIYFLFAVLSSTEHPPGKRNQEKSIVEFPNETLPATN